MSTAAWLGILYLAVAGTAAAHVLLFKRDPRSAWAWLTVCWLFPLGGSLLYLWFGVNRVERRAVRELRQQRIRPPGVALPDLPGVARQELVELARTGESVTGRALEPGNAIEAFHNGEQAYPAMLAAIGGARRSVWMSSYIFDPGEVGVRFARALAEARSRGVQVRVLLDGVGDFYLGARGSALLEEYGVRGELFLPLRLLPPMLHVNLRNHRKLLVVDGETAFLGGMNISDNHMLAHPSAPRADMQFRVKGPVVAQLAGVFADDWRDVAEDEEVLPRVAPLPPCGTAWCRAVTDGPNSDTGRLLLLLLSAIANAHQRICIMTPYFIPTPELVGALKSAALRGVAIDILLPERSDQRWVDWASRRWLRQMLGGSLRVFLQPAPFAHTKLFVVDGYYAQVGSANMDLRSLRLNFELNLEIYDAAVGASLEAEFDAARAHGRELTADEVGADGLGARLRNGFFWLFSPVL